MLPTFEHKRWKTCDNDNSVYFERNSTRVRNRIEKGEIKLCLHCDDK